MSESIAGIVFSIVVSVSNTLNNAVALMSVTCVVTYVKLITDE